MKNDSDSSLASKIKKGDKCALKELYDRYHKQMYFIGMRYLRQQYLAEDAVQDVFLKIWKKRDSLVETSSIKGFLFTTLKNHLIDMMRKKETRDKVKANYKILSEDTGIQSSTLDKVIYTEYEDLVQQALEKLTPAQRKVFKMKSFEGLSNEEVAKKNNVSINTVKTQYYHSSKFIRDFLGKRGII
ncbi:RNA polymerase sigma-70 factor [Aliifodinibius sp. S!AR15-10]|uniref:RNA polymerase sigma factor n=1 Tax=Aliifodinibius sp. S!AR15-10 TaxID=2950437 RepID=UPI002862C03D|nr:RNA polymerase sigma-70 factor [Aliifodinibius sp. S!AR15-10]MDR8392700.1 RNA polymerase sigma-70 factor [Aliifodinibius sp. S!AR15-10]